MTPAEFRSIRERAGINQAEAAKLGKLCPVTISRFECNWLGKLRRRTRLSLEKAHDAMHALLPEAERDLCDWSKLHDGPNQRAGQHREKKPSEFNGHDRAWLKRQVEHWLKADSLGVVAKEGCAYFVVSPDAILDFFEKVIEVTGGKLK